MLLLSERSYLCHRVNIFHFDLCVSVYGWPVCVCLSVFYISDCSLNILKYIPNRPICTHAQNSSSHLLSTTMIWQNPIDSIGFVLSHFPWEACVSSLWLQKCVCPSKHLWCSSSVCWVHWSCVFLVVMWRHYQLLIDHSTASPGTLIWGCISPKRVSRLPLLDSGLST
jgi:hypothetical protein